MKTPPYDNPCRAAVGPLSGGPTRVAIRGPSRAWPTLARPERSKLNPLVHGFKVAATHGRPPLFLDVPVRFATSLPTSAFVRHAQSCIAPPAFTSRQKPQRCEELIGQRTADVARRPGRLPAVPRLLWGRRRGRWGALGAAARRRAGAGGFCRKALPRTADLCFLHGNRAPLPTRTLQRCKEHSDVLPSAVPTWDETACKLALTTSEG